MTLWVMAASPLLSCTDVRNMSASVKAIWTNPEMLAVHKDPLAKMVSERQCCTPSPPTLSRFTPLSFDTLVVNVASPSLKMFSPSLTFYNHLLIASHPSNYNRYYI